MNSKITAMACLALASQALNIKSFAQVSTQQDGSCCCNAMPCMSPCESACEREEPEVDVDDIKEDVVDIVTDILEPVIDPEIINDEEEVPEESTTDEENVPSTDDVADTADNSEEAEPEVFEEQETPEEAEPEEPEIVEPEVTEPEIVEPEVVEPEVTEPEIVEPEVTEPEIVEPEVTEPEIVEPEVTEPEIVEPEVVEPEIVEPEEPVIETIQYLQDGAYLAQVMDMTENKMTVIVSGYEDCEQCQEIIPQINQLEEQNPHAIFRKYDSHKNEALANDIARVAGHPPSAPALALFVNGKFGQWQSYKPNMLDIQPIIDEMSAKYVAPFVFDPTQPMIESLPDGATLAQVMNMAQGRMTIIEMGYEGCETCERISPDITQMQIDNPHTVFTKFDIYENPSLTTEIGRVSHQGIIAENQPQFALFVNDKYIYTYRYANNLGHLQELISGISPRYVEPSFVFDPNQPMIESLPDGANLAEVMEMSEGKMTIIELQYEGCRKCQKITPDITQMEINNPNAVFRKYDIHENPSLTTEIERVSHHVINAEDMPWFALFVNKQYVYTYAWANNLGHLQELITGNSARYEGNTLAQIYSHRSGLQQHLAALF